MSLKNMYITWLMDNIDYRFARWEIARENGKCKATRRHLAILESLTNELNFVADQPAAAISRYLRTYNETDEMVNAFFVEQFGWLTGEAYHLDCPQPIAAEYFQPELF